MSFDRLTPVWPLVIDFLVPGVPKPLSGVTQQEYCQSNSRWRATLPDENDSDATSRRDIRVSELAVLMRTSIAFNHLVSRRLYRTIVTDNLSGLVSGFQTPSANPSIDNKAELLRYTSRLHLEYCRKGDGATYTALMRNEYEWQTVGCPSRSNTAIIEGAFEASALTGALYADVDPFNPASGVPFPHLRTLTIGSIFGGQDRLWQAAILVESEMSSRPDDPAPPLNIEQTVDACSMTVRCVFDKSPILHFCQRGALGSLSWPSVYNKGPEEQKLPSADGLYTIHFGNDTSIPFQFAIALKTRWVLEEDLRISSSITELCDIFYSALDRVDAGSAERGDQKAIDIQIYGSAPRKTPAGPDRRSLKGLLSPAEERVALKHAKEKKRVMRRGEGKGDSKYLTSWEASVDTPPCLACGWAFQNRA